MTPPLWLIAAVIVASASWFVAAWWCWMRVRGDLVYRVWALTAAWFGAAAFCVVNAPTDRLFAVGGWAVGVSAVGSFVVDELIERRW